MMIREKIRASLIGGTSYERPPSTATASTAPNDPRFRVGARVASFPSLRCKVLIYGSAIKTSHKPQRISYLQISNRRFRRGLAFAQAMLSAGLQHFSFHGIIGLLCSQ